MNLSRYSLCFLSLLILASCTFNPAPQHPGVPTQPPAAPPRILGIVEVSMGEDVSSMSFHFMPAQGLEAQTVQPNVAAIFEAMGVSVFDVSEEGERVRYMYNSYRVTANEAFSNLTLYALHQSTQSLGGTAIKRLSDFGGGTVTDAAAARNMLPSHAMQLNPTTFTANVLAGGTHMQAFTQQEASEVQAAALSAELITANDRVLFYGFVAQQATGQRGFMVGDSGNLTLALRFPLPDPATAPFRFTWTYLLVDDSTTRVTESLEEQVGVSGVQGRADALGAGTQVALLGASTSTVTGHLVIRLCTVVTAVDAWGNPDVYLVNTPEACPSAPANVLHVRANATGTGDGSSWTDAYPHLQDALAAARTGSLKDIWLASGTYYPDTGSTVTDARGDSIANPANNREATFCLTEAIRIYGGFAGTETRLEERPLSGSPTILSGDIDQDGTLAGNSFHVLWLEGTGTPITAATVIDGLTVTAGNANGSSPHSSGGGLYCHGRGNGNECSPIIRNVIFSHNHAGSNGGALYNDGFDGNSSPTLSHVTFSHNHAESSGGAVYNNGYFFGSLGMDGGSSSPILSHVTFSYNSAGLHGGALYNNGGGGSVNESKGSSSPILSDVSFSHNSAGSRGGALYNDGGSFGSSSPTLSHVTFSHNSAGFAGGAIYNDASTSGTSSPTLSHVIFSHNSAASGGAMYNGAFRFGRSSPTLTNVIFSHNSARSSGGAVFNDGSAAFSSPTLTNVSFSYNSAGNSGGAMYNDGGITVGFYGSSSPTLTNVILWGNTATTGSQLYNANASPDIHYSIVEGGLAGIPNHSTTLYENNLETDPLFVDAANGNLRLQAASPAINAGDSAAVPAGVSTDLDGNPRIVGAAVDMGAYEYQTP